MKQWSHLEFCRMLVKNGYHLERKAGGHSIYANEDGIHIAVPTNIRCVIAKRLIKQHNLKT